MDIKGVCSDVGRAYSQVVCSLPHLSLSAARGTAGGLRACPGLRAPIG